jgi:hypothetical protein
MKHFKIKAKLDAPAGTDTDGYSVYDYFTTDILGTYSTPDMAQEVAEVGYKGRDEFGVGVTWEIVEAEHTKTEE